MDYVLKQNFPLRINHGKSQSVKKKKFQKTNNNQKFLYSPSITTTGELAGSHWGGELKKYKSNNKTLSVNSLPKIDSFFNSNTIMPNSTSNKGQFELFVRNRTSYFKNSDLGEENINDEHFAEIELLWDELGITDEYQDQFELYLGTINNSERKKNFLLLEKNNLIKVKEALIKFGKEKRNRLKNIELLKKLNNTIKQNKNEQKINKELLKQIVDCIKTLRINSVNVVNNLIKVRESLNCFSLEDKINFNKINKNYYFDNNYLLKMNSEMSFLKYSEIDKIFEKNDPDQNIDAFLTIYNNIKNKENEKISNMITKELSNAIEKSRYYIMQDSFLNNIKMRKILKRNRNNGPKTHNKNLLSQMTLTNCYKDTSSNNFIDAKLHKLKSELGKNYNNIFLNSNRQNSNIGKGIGNQNNNKIYNFNKNKSKKGMNINVEIGDSPYKINNNFDLDLDLDYSYKNNLENYKSDYKLNDEINEEKSIEVDDKSDDNFNIFKGKESEKKFKKYDEEIININNIFDEKKKDKEKKFRK